MRQHREGVATDQPLGGAQVMGVGNLAFGGAVRSAWNGREVSGPDGTTVTQLCQPS